MTATILFVRRYWQAVVGMALLAVIGVQQLRIERGKATTAHVYAALERGKAAFDRTVANYRLAAVDAARRDAQNVIRVQAEQVAITERVSHDYQDRVRDSDARYQRLLAQAAAYPGSGAAADVPVDRDATCRAYANARCDELPGLLKAAQDNTDQLLALIAWSEQQATVNVGGGEK